MHLGGHRNTQTVIRVGDVEQCVVEHRTVRLAGVAGLRVKKVLRRRFRAFQLGVIAFFGIAEDGEIDLLPWGDMNHVGLRDLRLDGHGVQIRQFENHRRQLAGDHGLPFLRHDTHYITADRRDDAGVTQVDPGGLDLDSCVAHLCLQRAQVGTADLEVRLRRIEVLLRDRVIRTQLLVALVNGFGVLELCNSRVLLGDQVLFVDLRLAQGVLQHNGIDFRQPLTLFDLVTQIDLQ